MQQLPSIHQALIDRFVQLCQNDDRIVAAYLSGSYARGAADAYSDIDLRVITTDEAFDDFISARPAFLRQLGDPVFEDSFGIPHILLFILSNGIEGELNCGRESQFESLDVGPFAVLVDKKNILDGFIFQDSKPEPEEQVEKLRSLIFGFWHDLSHFITAIGRGKLWWAQGELEFLRGVCVSRVRLQNDFFDPEAGKEPYFKLEREVPVDQLTTLQGTFVPLEKEALLKAGLQVLDFYKPLARSLAQLHGFEYPAGLEQAMGKKMAYLRSSTDRKINSEI